MLASAPIAMDGIGKLEQAVDHIVVGQIDDVLEWAA